MTDLPTIGWCEWLRFPALDIGPIKAKVDSGAATSALHARNVVVEDGSVSFDVDTIQRSDAFTMHASAPVLEMREVRDSGGSRTTRPVIVTDVEMAGRRWPIELTLIDRSDMAFRVLLGRQALRGRFVVDVSRQTVLGTPEAVRSWPGADGP